MKYNPPHGSVDPDAIYVDVIPGQQRGSPVPAAAVEYPQREILSVILAAGLAPTNADLTQLKQAILHLIALATNRSSARQETTLAAALAANAIFTVPSYVVGSNALKIYLGGVLCSPGTAGENGFYQELGAAGATSTTIQIFEAVPVGKIITALVGA